MGSRVKTHSLKAIVCDVGAVSVGGYDEDGGVTIEPNADVVEMTVGGDGEAIANVSGDTHAVATITVMQTSRAFTLLQGQMEIQHRTLLAGTPLIPVTFNMINPATGEGCSSAQCVFLNRPANSQMKKATTREFRLFLADPQYTPAFLNAI